ncbi:class I SAM-dependent methyltransferase [Streptomyces olivaceus]|uniref:class I SAM-dependent methyltransferase n=1 Tax=Streptomyces olivaceus TaxID=47716 RepID=UPI001CCD6D5E|nr:L-histidine N(alpha)-methyltransferase [Streptomyces olivaceus]MBZ6140544.1 class I SAM-dependent methyltransferase [Streptomyces olivaceus]MBZ6168306.1 class I SAM-dependent methyltransferase [Streptomyces olivaceus]MBZ6175211.1 class I SAM-dependent methyltransferase [Streptomyces olivaceus]MBZ6181653.1 class I SAM-dependent methyltransferase [Streptomyces olivaceus]
MDGTTGAEEYSQEVTAWLRRGVLPVRYMYTGSGAALHIGFAEEYPDEYVDGRCAHETAVITRGLGRARLPAQVCDIGPSNGVHTHQFLTWFARQHRGVARYLGVDVSPELLEAARERNRPHASVEQHFATWDIESTATAPVEPWRAPGPVLFCLFGNTLGNVEGPAHVLRNVFRGARPGDILALGLYGPPRPGQQDAAAYRSPAVREMITGPLTAAGLPRHSFSLELSTAAEAVVGTARLTVPVSLPGACFPAGHEIRCFLSRRFHPAGAHRLLRDTGWLPRPPSAVPADGHFVVLGERMPSSPG